MPTLPALAAKSTAAWMSCSTPGAGSEPSRKPAVPTMSHFGELDTHIPVDGVKAFEKLHPEVEVHLYDASHGFNCEQRGSYNAGAAATALERSLFHFGKHVG